MKEKEKKKKKDKNTIEIDREVWNAMNYTYKECNHALVNNYTNKCIYCGKDMNVKKR